MENPENSSKKSPFAPKMVKNKKHYVLCRQKIIKTPEIKYI